jgi:hypothetical protein
MILVVLKKLWIWMLLVGFHWLLSGDVLNIVIN